jgi:rod shape-determining protein MreD
MRVNYHNASWVIWLTLALALMLSVLPMPEWAGPWRPLWLLVTLVYWSIALPERVGIGIAWASGLLIDVLNDTLLGENALALAVVAWLCIRYGREMRAYTLPRQLLIVAMMVVIHQLVILGVRMFTGNPPQQLAYWLPVLTSALIWPWMLSLLRDLRHRFRVR